MKEEIVSLVIEGTYPWYRGGVSEWVHQYLKSIRSVSFNIVQIATDKFRDAPIREALYDVPAHVQKFERVPPPDLTQSWSEESEQWLGSIQQKVKPLFKNSELVHIANTGAAGWLGKEMAQQCQKPLLLTEHALYWKEIAMGAVALECGYKVPRSSVDKQSFTHMFKNIAAEIYEEADKVISVSRCNMDEQEKLGARDIAYIPNGVPQSWLRRSPKKQFSEITIGWVGRCAEMKNPMKFFEVIEAFRAQNVSNAHFLMLSCDADESRLEQKVKDKARKYPELTFKWNRSTAEYIDRMDALCVTSHNESQPLVLFEALSRKVLPIGWKTGDVTNRFGLILESGASADQLVDKVMGVWRMPEQWEKEVQRGFREIEMHHTWEAIFDRYKDLLNSSIKS